LLLLLLLLLAVAVAVAVAVLLLLLLLLLLLMLLLLLLLIVPWCTLMLFEGKGKAKTSANEPLSTCTGPQMDSSRDCGGFCPATAVDLLTANDYPSATAAHLSSHLPDCAFVFAFV